MVIGVALSLSSSAFVLQLLNERGEMATKFGSATLGILLMQVGKHRMIAPHAWRIQRPASLVQLQIAVRVHAAPWGPCCWGLASTDIAASTRDWPRCSVGRPAELLIWLNT